MHRIVTQLKKRIDGIDFRKIYKGFTKSNFLLEYENTLYGVDKTYTLNNNEKCVNYIMRDDILYVVSKYQINNFSFDEQIVDIIVKMFNVYIEKRNDVDYISQKLQIITAHKDANYYELKYKQNLMLSKILSGNVRLLNSYKELLNANIKTNEIIFKEEKLESTIGLEKYVKLQILKIINIDKFNEALKPIISILEDPTKLFNYFNYVKSYSAAHLLAVNMEIPCSNNIKINLYDNLMINFDNLIISNNIRVRRLMMYKMIHAKKMNIGGTLKNANIEKIIGNDNLYYLPDYIEYFEHGLKKYKKGDFIIKLNEKLEIFESYECLSMKKII